ncbi:hypothetical protein C9I57_00160 [Trinickia symbiotica]|uniref:Uncharacterized protein n=1 Tax=Trinickia symbiotica TaxID=863227 RepID=A0A2T3Y0I7_9BURK|nr:hypothetical protein C9I57_00160 [Trinickia symbiotica]
MMNSDAFFAFYDTYVRFGQVAATHHGGAAHAPSRSASRTMAVQHAAPALMPVRVKPYGMLVATNRTMQEPNPHIGGNTEDRRNAPCQPTVPRRSRSSRLWLCRTSR